MFDLMNACRLGTTDGCAVVEDPSCDCKVGCACEDEDDVLGGFATVGGSPVFLFPSIAIFSCKDNILSPVK